MAEHLLISQSSFLCRVALVSDDRVIEYREEHRHADPVVGALYKAKVARSLDALEAVLVDYGGDALGFLPMDEVTPESVFSATAPKRLKPGQEVWVQITKASQHKTGPRLTGKFSFPGRYWVYLPCAEPEVRVARRLGGKAERSRLRDLFAPLLETRGAMVLRSSAPTEETSALRSELMELRALWGSIREGARAASCGDRLHCDHLLPLRALRDQVSSHCAQIYVDDSTVGDILNAAIDSSYPELRGKVVLASSASPLFARFGVESQLSQAGERRFPLRGGGGLVFDETEAMVVVDVNAGNPEMGAANREAAHLATNLEAAREVALQIRLRDLTGIIVVDFINLRSGSGIRKVEEALREALIYDPVRSDASSMSRLGLIQIMRSEGRRTSYHRPTEPCAHCQGRGQIPTQKTRATRVLHRLERLLMQEQVQAVEIRGPACVLDLLSGELASALDRLATEYAKRIVLSPGGDYHLGGCVLHVQTSAPNRSTKG